MEYTSEQLNYFRICYIAFNLVPEGLRQVFKQEWDFLYKTTPGEWEDTPKNGSDFYNKESRKSRSKNKRYLLTIQNGNRAVWDCSCLFFAILFSDSIGTTLNPAIWKEVDDLRQVRNDIAHVSEAQLTDPEFKGYVERVLLALNRLSLPMSDIEAIKNQTNFPTAEVSNFKAQVANLQSELKEVKFDLQAAQNTIQEKEEQVECLTQEINSKVESFCTLTSAPSHQIIKRLDDVTRIMAKMQELDDGSSGLGSTIYLSGNPGCGKTQLARQIGEEFFNVGSGEGGGLIFVATMNAETLETLADSYFSLARQLGITEYTLTNLATMKDVKLEERIQQLRCYVFPKIKQFSKWLIIADNVVDLSSVCKYLPQTASEDWGHGQVLITTHHSSGITTNAPHTYHESLSAGMQPREAIKLLEQVSRISNDKEVEKVAEVLEYQPLALASAGFYLQFVRDCSPTYGWTNFLERLAKGGREVTEEPLAGRNPAYSKTMNAAVELALESILESDDILRQTFLFFSLCDSVPLPIQAALNFVKSRTSGQTDELIRVKILKSSLIMHLCSENGAPGYLRMHNVVHQVLKKMPLMKVTEHRECLSVAVQVFHSLITSWHNRLGERRHICVMLRMITVHSKALYEILTNTFAASDVLVTELATFISPENLVSWLCSTALVFYNLSNLSDAIRFSTSACDFVQYLSNTRKGNVIKGFVFNTHGLTLSMTCQYKPSISYHEEAAAIYTEIFGEDNADVAETYNNLGSVHRQLGLYNEARHYHEKALIIRTKTFGDDHADVATSHNDLGSVYWHLGQYHEAGKYHEKALIIRKKIFGEDHADVAGSYNNLGSVYLQLGQYNEAQQYHEKALIIRKNIFGEDHADVAGSYNNMGSVYWQLGQYNKAKQYQERALSIREKIFGEDHVDVTTSYNDLGIVHQDLGEYNKAKQYHEKALIIREKIFGENHTDVAGSYNNLGSVYWQLGQYNEAKQHHKKALIIKKKIFGEDHADVATCYNNVGSVYQELGQYNEAKQHHKKALIIRKKIVGENHADVATSYNNLGSVYLQLGQYNEAKQYHEKALIIRQKIFGEDHANVAGSYNNLGCVYLQLGQYNEAKQYHEKALIIRQKIFGEDHSYVVLSYNNLGNVYQALKQDDFRKNAIEILKLGNQTKRKDNTPSSSSKLPRLENC